MAATIVPNDPTAATANALALEQSTGRVTLPAGVVSVDRPPAMTAANAGLVMSGETIKSEQRLGSWLDRAALQISCGADNKAALSWRGDETPASRPAVMPAGQVGWLFEMGSEGWTHPRPNIRLLPGQALPEKHAGYEMMRAWRGVPFTTGVKEFTVAVGHGVVAGERLWATDGPSFNECVGEHALCVASTARTITLARSLTRQYRQGTFCRGPFPSRMTFSGLTFAGQLGSLVAMQAAGVTWSDCRADSPVGANGTVAGLPHFLYCTDVDLVRCNLAGIKMSSGLRLRARDCTAGIVTAEQGQIETTLTNCRVGWLDALHQCDRWKLTGCHFSDWFGIYDGWTVLDCTCNGLVRVRGKDCTIDGLRAIGPVIVQNAYGHGPPDAATGVHLSNVDCEYVELLPGTSGRIAKCNARIVCRDPATKANWKLDGGVIP